MRGAGEGKEGGEKEGREEGERKRGGRNLLFFWRVANWEKGRDGELGGKGEG